VDVLERFSFSYAGINHADDMVYVFLLVFIGPLFVFEMELARTLVGRRHRTGRNAPSIVAVKSPAARRWGGIGCVFALIVVLIVFIRSIIMMYLHDPFKRVSGLS